MEKLLKTWETPQLIILARGTPAETLESGCKIIAIGISGQNGNTQDSCNRTVADDKGGNCGACRGRSGGS